MPTATLTQALTGIGSSISKTQSFEASAAIDVEETVADATTDLQINQAIDVSVLVLLYIVATVDMTLETNDGTTPDDTIALVANVPRIAPAEDLFPSTVDVVSFFVTNASGAAGVLKIKGLQDATP